MKRTNPLQTLPLLCALAMLPGCEEKIDYGKEEALAVDIDQDLKTALTQHRMPLVATKMGCSNCHALDDKRIGPSWQAVSKRYQNSPDYEYEGKRYPLTEGLVQKVSNGGGGIWGIDAMPAMDPGGRKREEITKLVGFILKLGKQ